MTGGVYFYILGFMKWAILVVLLDIGQKQFLGDISISGEYFYLNSVVLHKCLCVCLVMFGFGYVFKPYIQGEKRPVHWKRIIRAVFKTLEEILDNEPEWSKKKWK